MSFVSLSWRHIKSFEVNNAITTITSIIWSNKIYSRRRSERWKNRPDEIKYHEDTRSNLFMNPTSTFWLMEINSNLQWNNFQWSTIRQSNGKVKLKNSWKERNFRLIWERIETWFDRYCSGSRAFHSVRTIQTGTIGLRNCSQTFSWSRRLRCQSSW